MESVFYVLCRWRGRRFKYVRSLGFDGRSFCLLSACLYHRFVFEFEIFGYKKWILGSSIALPILGFIGVVGVFTYFSFDYDSEYAVQVEQHKSVLETLQFRVEKLGAAFHYMSGNASSYENGQLIPITITPRVKNTRVLVPSDDETYLAPDILMEMEKNSTQEVLRFLADLEQELQLSDTKFTKMKSKLSPKLLANTEIWSVQHPQVSYQDR